MERSRRNMPGWGAIRSAERPVRPTRLSSGPLLAFLFLVGLACAASAFGQGPVWPAGQVFPRFADYSSLDIVDISGLPFDRKVAITTLQGSVNRSKPRLYLLDAQQAGEGKNFWLDRLSAAKAPIADPLSVFTRYRSDIAGLCVYDPAVMGTVDVAATAAGVTGCVVVSPSLAQTLSAAPYNLGVTLDLRNRGFASDRAAFAWARTEYWPKCSHRMLAGMRPGVHYTLYDYIVANKAFCAWLAPETAQDGPLLDSLFKDMPVNGVYVGWWAGETDGVGYASRYGVATFATDWFCNATVHGGGSAALPAFPETAAPPKLENRAYIALILSDGDNIQEQEHLFPMRWNSPLRGSFPVSWTQSPALVDFAPAMLGYYYSTRTPDDCFITGPSGFGYVLPEKMGKENFRAFARLTAAYLGKTGIRTATIWGNSASASDIYGQECPALFGLANKQGGAAPMGQRYWAGGIASVEMDPDYASFGSQILDVVNARLRNWDRKKPLFIAPQLNANVAGLDEFKKVVDALKGNADVTFVRADQLFQLMRAANPNPVGLSPLPFAGRARDAGPGLLIGGPGQSFGRSGPAGLRPSSYPGFQDVSGKHAGKPGAFGAWIGIAR